MTPLVVDASVAVKWFVPEPSAERALPLLDGSFDLLAPDLLLPEVGTILWKKVRRKEIAARDAQDIVAALARVPLTIVSSGALLDGALEIALEYERSVHDALHVALAVARDHLAPWRGRSPGAVASRRRLAGCSRTRGTKCTTARPACGKSRSSSG